MKFGEFFLKCLKNPITYFVIFILSFIIHNLWYALFGYEDAIFFILAVAVSPIGFVISLTYFIAKKNSNKIKLFYDFTIFLNKYYSIL